VGITFHQECIEAWQTEQGHRNVPCPGCIYCIEQLVLLLLQEKTAWTVTKETMLQYI
jgi:hypothetical protein